MVHILTIHRTSARKVSCRGSVQLSSYYSIISRKSPPFFKSGLNLFLKDPNYPATRRDCLPQRLTITGPERRRQMENKLAEELYGESLQHTTLELTSSSGAEDKQISLNDCDGDNLDNEEGSLCDGSDDGVNKVSDLEREWQRRHDQFHTIGYRDGLIAGKEASAQEGFNIGFKQSVLVGYSWGLVRGITSAFAAFPDTVKKKLVERQDKRNEFQRLHESMYSLSTADALRLFSEDIEAKEQGERIEASLHTEDLLEQSSINCNLGYYFGQLQSLIRDSPEIDIQLPADK